MLTHKFHRLSAVIMIVLFTAAAAPAWSAVIPASDIQDAVANYVSGISGTDNIEYSAVIPRLFDVNVECSGATVIEVSHDAGKKIGQILPVTVTIKDTDGETIKQLRVSPKLRKFGIAAVLNKNIARGESIAKSDVGLKKVDITAVREFYSSCAEVSGMEAKKYLKAGAVISESDIRTPYAVKRGDKVTVEIRTEGLLLRTDGTARGNGSKGEFIKIYVDMTKTTISCKIVDSMTVVAGVEGG
ncbi:flagellar basal body P-ring formation chaperone FlgA [Candidatus Latescibacterota bacterium]